MMLPSKYMTYARSNQDKDDEEDGENGRPSNRRMIGVHPSQGQPPNNNNNDSNNTSLYQPPLGLTGVLCTTQKLPIRNRGVLHYTVFRPRNLQHTPPLICVAGGPLLPSIYLHPIVHLITDRSIIFYDAIGCGQSSKLQPKQIQKRQISAKQNHQQRNPSDVRISDMVQDLACLIQHLALPQFHLLGHSFGGILVYEYLKQQQQSLSERQKPQRSPGSSCLSLVLVSTPVSIAQAIEHSHHLQSQVRRSLQEGDNHVDEDGNAANLAEYAKRHECRMDPIPLPLQQTLFSVFSSTSKGLAAVQDYTARISTGDSHVSSLSTATTEEQQEQESDNNGDKDNKLDQNKPEADGPSTTNNSPPSCSFPISLVIRGEYDFVSQECQEDWGNLLLGADKKSPAVKFVTIPNSAHYAMLENEDAFANAIRRCFSQQDPPAEFITLPNGVKVRR